MLMALGLSVMSNSGEQKRGTEETTSFHDFLKFMPPRDSIDKIVVKDSFAQVKLVSGHSKYFKIPNVEIFESLMEQAQAEAGIQYEKYIPIYYDTEVSFLESLAKSRIVMYLALFGMTYMLLTRIPSLINEGMKGSNFFSKSQAKKFDKIKDVKVRFEDVAGLDEAKVEIMEFVSFLKQPEEYQKLGAKIPRGALLVGPPGTGKTLLAKATAGEAGVPFLSISGSDFVELYVGVGPSRVRHLFREAKESSPSLIFIDEIDAIGRKRGQGARSHDERESTLNQLLVEMDGFDTDSQVVVIAGTNIPEVLDPALLRAGRFDRQVAIDNPDIRSRKSIFMVYLKKITLSPDLNMDKVAEKLAAMSPGLSGADIAAICNEAALRAARYDKEGVEMVDFENAIERIVVGLERRLVLSPEEKKTIAYHEAGHAVLGWFLEHTHPLMKLSIIPRGAAALGYAQYLPKDQYLYTRPQFEDMICMALGGRIAEEITFGEITTGARDDLDRVTKSLYSLVTKYGMGKIGAFSFPDSRGEGRLSQYSETTASEIDDEVRGELMRLYERAKQVLLDNQKGMNALAETLLKKEVLSRKEVADILGPRPYEVSDVALDMYDGIHNDIEVESEEKTKE
eukprot:CAMPEP_0201484996 /NCGR_PEP_ID=MMETSP0151_2-20130828/9133_1 /ASSEMBLY_ACC=CAM_ASM_000257 /TAXON_ID=200890 /ORGANISM="Paramoeba atlantica, Strain 621/1 / CCAP 1560/9" /LENGTH=622 /DNA_ID=CAMNT_0047868927 /DNA_START=499 /DNA_END=2367 /DNA_ORIENTATION=+